MFPGRKNSNKRNINRPGNVSLKSGPKLHFATDLWINLISLRALSGDCFLNK